MNIVSNYGWLYTDLRQVQWCMRTFFWGAHDILRKNGKRPCPPLRQSFFAGCAGTMQSATGSSSKHHQLLIKRMSISLLGWELSGWTICVADIALDCIHIGIAFALQGQGLYSSLSNLLRTAPYTVS